MDATIEQNKALVEEYPFLIPRSRWTGKVAKDYDYSYTELDSLSDGWRIAFGDLMLQEIREQLIKEGTMNSFQIDDLKSKYGSMAFYFHGASDKVGRIIDKYSLLSQFICEICGKPNVRSTKGWITPICFDCWKKIHHYDDNDAYKQYLEATYDDHTKMPTKMRWRTYEDGKWRKNSLDISKTVGAIKKAYKERINEATSSSECR